MEIKVGEYVRTDNGIIGKYVKYRGIEDTIENNYRWIGFDIEKDIVKHSKNIADLIEVEDYVNGHKVIDIAEGNIRALYLEQVHSGALVPTLEKDIKTILTKEQYEANCYRLEEK